jgi:glyoxylase-like metal-dependent hydrolase (beta-lactamase superfamily II)
MNSYIVRAGNSEKCILIDPGDDLNRIEAVIDEESLIPERIFNTHNHIDHARRVSLIQKKYDLPFYICQEDLPLLESIKDQALLFGLDVSPIPKVTKFVKDGDVFTLGEETFRILQTPGHSPGSICLYFEGHIFVGDVLFKDSIGRTDLYGGNYKQLLQSIEEKLLVLPDDTIVYPGHGPETTIGREKQFNPFLKPGNYI